MNQKENNLLWLGTIVNTHGIKGEVRVLSDSDSPNDRFKVGNILYYFKNNNKEELIIKTSRLHKQFILLTFEGINNINEIEWIKSSKIYCLKDKLENDEYYLSELIDKQVKDQSGEIIGVATSLINQGPYESLFIKLNNGNLTNIPLIEEFDVKFDGEIVTIKVPKDFLN